MTEATCFRETAPYIETELPSNTDVTAEIGEIATMRMCPPPPANMPCGAASYCNANNTCWSKGGAVPEEFPIIQGEHAESTELPQ